MSLKNFSCFLLTLTVAVDANIIGGDRQFSRQARDVASEGISDCTFTYNAIAGDSCASIGTDWGITPEQLLTYNPSLKSDCSGLEIGHSYCVEENFGRGPASPSTTSISLTPSASLASATSTANTSVTSTGPRPTQAGLTSQCTTYYKVQAGDFCSRIVSDYHTFSLQDFYSWNPAVGSNCESLFGGYYVCVGVTGTSTQQNSSTTTVQTAATSVPSPTQSGIASTCVKYYRAVSGDSCTVIVDKFGTFSVSDFQEWNPAVGSACTQLFLGYYYCIAVPGTPVERPSTTGPTSPISTGPSPVQAGIVSSCTKYYEAVSGDSCQAITDQFGTFSLTEFEAWNPAVQPDCSLLFLGYYYCIAIPDTPATRPSTPAASQTGGGPQPQQPGIVSNCNRYYQVKSGDGCEVIEQKNEISSQQFLQWNTGIASDCSNVFLGYYVCTGVSG